MEGDIINGWSFDVEGVLENIRINCVILSTQHKKKYIFFKGYLKYFRIPVICISGFTSIFSVGLQPYMEQGLISAITCVLSLSCSIIGSIELFLSIQSNMEDELIASKDFYLLGIEIFKMLSLSRENRAIDGKVFLEDKFATYQKLIENNSPIQKSIKDNLSPIPVALIPVSSVLSNSSGSEENNILI
jgi:hypothetical protein